MTCPTPSALNSNSRGKPSFDLGELGRGGRWCRSRCRSGCILLNSLQPGCHLIRCEHVSLAANCQGTFEDVELLLEGERVSERAGDIVLSLPLNLWRIRASQSGNKGEQLLPLLVVRLVVQEHS